MNPIKKILSAFFIAVIICSIAAFVVNKGLEKYSAHINGKFSEVFIDSTYHDMLFIGSSRVHSIIDPATADSISGMNTYNAGLDGANMYEFKTIIDGYLVNHRPPKYLLMGIDLFSFDNRRRLFNYSNYLPYYNNEKVDSVLLANNHYPFLYKYLPFFRLAELDDYSKSNAVRGFMGKTDINPGEMEYKGYLTLSGHLDTAHINLPAETMNIDKKAIGYLGGIIQSCKSLNIKLVFMYAPEYRKSWQNVITNAGASFAVIDSIAEKNTIQFYRYDNLSLCNNPSLFYNVRHLNREGAKLFTVIAIKDILTQ